MIVLTLQMLKDLEPGIFDQGVTIDNYTGVNVANTDKVIKWVAVRGRIHDWAIYVDNPFKPFDTFEEVARNGDKITLESHIKRLIPCDYEAFDMYRY